MIDFFLDLGPGKYIFLGIFFLVITYLIRGIAGNITNYLGGLGSRLGTTPSGAFFTLLLIPFTPVIAVCKYFYRRKTVSFTIIALALAIPTFGTSLILWFWLKSKYDNKVVFLILAQIKISFNHNGSFQELFGVNNASIRKTFSFFGSHDLSEQILDGGTGLINHPELGEVYVVIKQAPGNRLLVSAAGDPVQAQTAILEMAFE